jgi:hypothetical protein
MSERFPPVDPALWEICHTSLKFGGARMPLSRWHGRLATRNNVALWLTMPPITLT